MKSSDPSSPSRKLSKRALILRVLVVLVGVVILGVVLVLMLLRSAPAHWKAEQAYRVKTPQVERAQLAERVQQHVANTVMNLDELPDGLVTLHVPVRNANAWMDLKLPGWLTHQNVTLPPEIRSPMIAVTGEDLIVAFEFGTGHASQVVSMAMVPQMHGEGRASLTLKSIKGGRLKLPLELITGALRNSSGPDSHGRAEFAAILEGQPFDARWTTDRGRECVLVDITLGDDAIDLVFRLHPPQLQ